MVHPRATAQVFAFLRGGEVPIIGTAETALVPIGVAIVALTIWLAPPGDVLRLGNLAFVYVDVLGEGLYAVPFLGYLLVGPTVYLIVLVEPQPFRNLPNPTLPRLLHFPFPLELVGPRWPMGDWLTIARSICLLPGHDYQGPDFLTVAQVAPPMVYPVLGG